MFLDDERYVEEYYQNKKDLFRRHPLRILFMEVTSRCNARCEHCGSSCGDFVPKDEVTAEELKDVLRKIAANKNYDPKRVMLMITGGEPLVKSDLFEIMEEADKLGYYWGMTTNGILIDEEVVQKMADTHMYSVSVSIDGLKETHESFRKVPGSFDKIIKGIKLMLECPSIKVVQVTTVINKKNIEQMDDVYELVKSLGVKYWRVVNVDPIGRAKNNEDILLDGDEFKRMINFIHEKQQLYEEKKIDMVVDYGCAHFLGKTVEPLVRKRPFICATGVIIGSILSNGDIFVCPDVARRPELIQGNIRKDDFIEVWEKKFKPYRKMSRTLNSKCLNCPDKKLCGGDAFHTWDFDQNKQLVCHMELFNEENKKETTKKKTTRKKATTTKKKETVKKKESTKKKSNKKAK